MISKTQGGKTMENNYEIKNKTFEKVTGKINANSLFMRLNENEISFEIECQNKDRHWFKTNEKAVLSKTLSLFKISRKELLQQLGEQKTTEQDILDFVRQTVTDKNRELVFLIDENSDLNNVVTKRHKQLPLKEIFETVNNIATASGFKINSITNNKDSYQINLNTGRNNDIMESQINVHLGTNNSKGRAGIRIQGSGSVFVCSNMIVAGASRDVMTKAKDLGLNLPNMNKKLVHTTNIGERFKKEVKSQMESAKETSIMLGNKLKQSQKIPMTRIEQLTTIDLICKKHSIGDKWKKLLKRNLYYQTDKEPEYNETLYELSQCLTYIGTHYQIGSENIRKTLCKVGGQVVLLGNRFVELMTEIVKEKEEKTIQVIN